MDSKQKNILRASIRVVVAAFAAFLAWISDAVIWLINSHANSPEPENNPDLHIVIEDGFLKAKAGDFESPMEELDDPRIRKR